MIWVQHEKKGIDYLPEIMVLNFMMLKNDQWETYEQAEINATKSICQYFCMSRLEFSQKN
jgi:hypothetical protein